MSLLLDNTTGTILQLIFPEALWPFIPVSMQVSAKGKGLWL